MSDLGRKKTYAGARLILLQDSVLCVLASLLSILVVRSLSNPIPHFSGIVLRYLLLALAGTLLGGFVSGLWKMEAHRMNSKVLGMIILFITLKEIVLAAALLTGFIQLPSKIFAFLAVSVDIVFTAVLLIAPRYIFATLRSEERAVAKRVFELGAGAYLKGETAKDIRAAVLDFVRGASA